MLWVLKGSNIEVTDVPYINMHTLVCFMFDFTYVQCWGEPVFTFTWLISCLSHLKASKCQKLPLCKLNKSTFMPAWHTGDLLEGNIFTPKFTPWPLEVIGDCRSCIKEIVWHSFLCTRTVLFAKVKVADDATVPPFGRGVVTPFLPRVWGLSLY